MPFAAAAVVGSARGSGRLGVGRSFPPLSPAEPQIRGSHIAVCLATCACISLNIAGLSMLADSFTDSRGALVADYDNQVENWEQSARGGFAALDIRVMARWNNGRNSSMTMNSSEEADPPYRDAEHGKGLLQHHPLTYVASFEFGSYYPGDAAQDARQWVLLPERSGAVHVTFEFTVRSRNGSSSRFATPPFPLVWDEIVHARTPAPEDKCARERHGIWRNRNCHIVKRLEQLCLQVQVDANGTWVPWPKELPSPEPTGRSASAEPGAHVSYGCDPHNAWNPASYSLDACWGRPVTQRCPRAPRTRHAVTVKLRSALDPYIRAEELTDDTFDFGLSPTSQKVNGAAMLAIGLCACMLPCARLYQCTRRRRRGEDCRGLRDDREDPDAGGCPPGIYGNSST